MVVIYARSDREKVVKAICYICEHLKKANIDYFIDTGCELENIREIPSSSCSVSECKYLMTVGGDGTVLSGVSKYALPVIGINKGTTGFMAEFCLEKDFDKIIEILKTGKYTYTQRIMLNYFIKKIDGSRISFDVLNDISVIRSVPNLININLSINSEQIHYRCDGLIISTPTGSTAYNLAARGPIVNYSVDCIILTPINDHSLINKTIILSPSDVINFYLTDKASFGFLSGDGIKNRDTIIGKDDLVQVKKSDKTIIIITNNSNFVKNVKNKLGWGN